MAAYVSRLARQSTALEIISELASISLPARYKMMRLGARSDIMRRFAAAMLIRHRPVRVIGQFAESSLFAGVSAGHVLADLNREGFAAGITLPESVVDDVLKFCSIASFSLNKAPERMMRIDYDSEINPSPPSFLYYCTAVHEKCSAIAEIATDPMVGDVVGHYLGTEPLLIGTRVFWSYPPPMVGCEAATLPDYGFHYDIDDFKFVKLFFYLTNVDEDSGPHTIIAGTHVGKSWSEKLHRRIDDARALALYGERIRTLTGRRGEGFFEDTFCYHKGALPRKPRLMLEFEWSLRSYRR
jgi:hypothetical protein